MSLTVFRTLLEICEPAMERVINSESGTCIGMGVLSRRLILTTVMVLPLFTWLASIGSPMTYFHYDLPPGQIMYILAKLAGLYAFAMLWLQIMFALLKNGRWSHYLLPQW